MISDLFITGLQRILTESGRLPIHVEYLPNGISMTSASGRTVCEYRRSPVLGRTGHTLIDMGGECYLVPQGDWGDWGDWEIGTVSEALTGSRYSREDVESAVARFLGES